MAEDEEQRSSCGREPSSALHVLFTSQSKSTLSSIVQMSAGGKSSSKRGRPAAAASAELIMEFPKSPEVVVIANA